MTIYQRIIASGTITATAGGTPIRLPTNTPSGEAIAIVLQPGRSGAVTLREIAGGPGQLIPAAAGGDDPLQVGPMIAGQAPLICYGADVSLTYTIWRVS